MINLALKLADCQQENERLRRELAALKDAARPVVEDWLNIRPAHVDNEGYEIVATAEQLDALAALVGEEGR